MRLIVRSWPKPAPMLLCWAAVAVYGFLSGVSRLSDWDIWFHIKAGQWIVQNRAVPRADIFSFSAEGQPWVAHEWGFDVLLALIHDHFGLLGLVYLKALLLSLTCVLLLWLCLRRGAALVPSLAVTWAYAVLAAPWANGRPLMVLPLMVVILLHILLSWEQGRTRVLWWLPPLFVIWINLHGAYVIGFAVAALYVVGRLLGGRWLRGGRPSLQPAGLTTLALAMLIAAAAVFLNPYGAGGVLYPFEYIWGASKWHQTAIAEYRSPDFHSPLMVRVGLFMLLGLVALIISPAGPTLTELLLAAAFVFTFLLWGRNGPLMMVVVAPILAGHLTERLRGSLARVRLPRVGLHPAVVWTLLALLAGALFVLSPRASRFSEVVAAEKYPLEAVQIVRLNRISGNMFNSYHWGGYLIYALWPQHKVFMDGRADMYGEGLYHEYERVARLGPDWQKVLERREIQWLLVHDGLALVRGLELVSDYGLIYSGGGAKLFVRKDGPNREVWLAAERGELKLPPGL